MRPLALLLTLLLLAPVASAEFGPYDETGYPVNVLGESTFPGGILPGGALPDGPVNVVGPMTVYPYYPVLTAEVQRLAVDHADLVRLHSLGKSTLGLDLWMLEIADFSRIDAGEGLPLEAREVVWVDGGTHSNEYSGVYFAAHLASFLLDEYATNETARWIVENRHVWILPMVNPDGSHAFGRLNANLVNINRNYPVVWDGAGNDAFMNNRGPEPASEVETQLNIAWFNETRPDYYASVHCCGNLWLYPYGEEGVDPVDNATLARVCQEAFPSVGDKCGPIWSTIYPASGSSVDTVYEYTGAVAFGYEMSGRGAVLLWGQPFTDKSVREQEVESWNGVLHALLNVHRYGAHLAVKAAGTAGDSLALSVHNDGYGPSPGGNVTLTLPSGAVRTAALPPLVPGGDATVEVGPLEAGAADVRLAYAKRIMPAREGVVAVPLEVQEAEGGFRVLLGDGSVSLLDAPSHHVPGPAPLALLVAVLALALAARRRRS